MTPAFAPSTARTTADMINDCFRHQHPEAYGRPETLEPVLPRELRYGAEEPVVPTPAIPEAVMGHPEARLLG